MDSMFLIEEGACAVVESVFFLLGLSFVQKANCPERKLLHQIHAVPDLCCIVTQRLVESVGGVFND